MTCGRGSRHGSVYESTIKPIIDKRCMQCHDGCNPNIPNPTAIIRDLARLLPDAHIASVLNRAGKRTGRDNTSQSRGFAPSAMIMTFPFIALANVPSVANCRSSKPLKLGHQEGASRGGFAPWFFPDTP